jgi:hypothetical protein
MTRAAFVDNKSTDTQVAQQGTGWIAYAEGMPHSVQAGLAAASMTSISTALPPGSANHVVSVGAGFHPALPFGAPESPPQQTAPVVVVPSFAHSAPVTSIMHLLPVSDNINRRVGPFHGASHAPTGLGVHQRRGADAGFLLPRHGDGEMCAQAAPCRHLTMQLESQLGRSWYNEAAERRSPS